MSSYGSSTVGFDVAFSHGSCELIGMDLVVGTQPHQWFECASDSDHVVLGYCVGPTLDVGCGPGRMASALATRRFLVLGIDTASEAVAQTVSRGASAIMRDVFEPLPAEGRWGTALLADGNIGIGGDPTKLLLRLRCVLSPWGRVVVDLAAWGSGLKTGQIQVVADGHASQPIPWAVVGADAIAELAGRAGFTAEVHHIGERWFGVLRNNGELS
jgi:SAM-dependent methyltransferase